MTDIKLSDKQTLRDRARKNVEEGAVTPGYSADREEIIRLLNESLATEWVCVLRYKRHYFMADGIKAHVAAEEFLEHANQEMEHADKLAERIVQLGGEPEFNPDLLSQNPLCTPPGQQHYRRTRRSVLGRCGDYGSPGSC